jgi:leucyl-tRNA synthetase
MKNYDHKKIESRIQKEWEKKQLYKAKDEEGKKFYSLIEFPYPSGDGLHVGHIRSNTAMDIISRKRRMEGYNVLYPIGWDAFGLPTENYAIKTGKKPTVVTKKNTDTFRKQLKALGFSFDWSREINTTDPTYYKWTQWIFLQFFKKGLAYKAKSYINWCPKDKIGLANEEAVGGICDRCGSKTEKREKEQWMLAITKYADRLDKDLDLVNYPERVKNQQRNWIGKSEGSEIEFSFCPCAKESIQNLEGIKIFTTRADTLFGVTYIVLAPEHILISKIKSRISNWNEVKEYIEKVKKETEIERTTEGKTKTGVEIKGVKAINPATKEEIPIYVADYVLADYGTGAVMAVPAHDERDWNFAKKYNLPIKEVIQPLVTREIGEDAFIKDQSVVERRAVVAVIKHWSEDKYLGVEWKKTGWKGFIIGGIENGEDAITAGLREITEETGYKNIEFVNSLGGVINARFYQKVKNQNRLAHFEPVLFKLKDGEKNEISEEEKVLHSLKWLSPSDIKAFINYSDMHIVWDRLKGNYCYTGNDEIVMGCNNGGILLNSGKFNGLYLEEAKKKITEFVGGKIVTKFKLRDWVFSRQRYWGEPIPLINCEKCGLIPVMEKDLPVKLPEVKNYKPTDTGESPLASISKWVNTECPKCKGKAKRETDTMPNWAGSSWYYLRYTDSKDIKVFADKKKLKYWTPVDWYNGGMEHTTLHLLYSRFWHKFLYDLNLVPTLEPYQKRTSHGMILGEGGVKMSKSVGNVVNPDHIIKTYGADTLRVYEMFIGPFEESVAWSTESIIGPRRFIEKVWRIGQKVIISLKDKSNTSLELKKLLNKTIKKVSEDIESMRFNTAVSAMMILATEIEKAEHISAEDYKKFLKILAPFAPHVVEDIWFSLKEKNSIHISLWPAWDINLIKEEEVKIAVQINGKFRTEIIVHIDEEEDEVKKKAFTNEIVLKYVNSESYKKIVYIKNRVINILS